MFYCRSANAVVSVHEHRVVKSHDSRFLLDGLTHVFGQSKHAPVVNPVVGMKGLGVQLRPALNITSFNHTVGRALDLVDPRSDLRVDECGVFGGVARCERGVVLVRHVEAPRAPEGRNLDLLRNSLSVRGAR